MKGLIGFDECKIALYDSYRERDDLKYAFAVERESVQLLTEINKDMNVENTILRQSNKTLKKNMTLWKIFAVTSTLLGFYVGTRL